MLWRSICMDCAGGIDTLVELLQGRFSKSVMERICRQDGGLFPKPSDIRFSCTCPDGASMCKHVAAVLYGVGARLDKAPELLFRLRAVDEQDLLADLDTALPISSRPLDARKVLEANDISALFGLDMDGGDGAIAAPGAAPAAPEPVARARQTRTSTKAGEGKTTVRGGSAPATQKANSPTAPSVVPKRSPARQISRTGRAGQATRSTDPLEQTEQTAPQWRERTIRTNSKNERGPKKQKTSKPEIELTPDGFVKWWK
jgi:uncharacterized Zn finger protein